MHLSTAELPERDRLAIWREVYGHRLFNLEIEPIGEDAFSAGVTMRRLPKCGITTGWRTPAHYRITKAHLQNAADTVMFITILSGRAHSTQIGRESMTAAGEAVALASSEIAGMALLDGARYLGVYLPRAMLAPMVPNLEAALARSLPPDSAGVSLLTGYAAMVQATKAPLTATLQHGLTAHFCDLVATALGASGEAAHIAEHRGIRAARLRAIRNDIAANLSSRDLSTDSVALRQGISPSYVRKLLDGEGTSFSDLVLRLRLARAHRLISDPREAARTIGAIAFDVGFGDLSYFNRTFRRQYGMTPSDLRSHALAMSS